MAVDLTKLAFYSEVNYMKRDVASGVIPIDVTGTTPAGTATITHNLGYIPFYQILWEQDNTGTIWNNNMLDILTDSSVGGNFAFPTLTSWITSTSLTINIYNNTGSSLTGTRNVYYIIYRDYGDVS